MGNCREFLSLCSISQSFIEGPAPYAKLMRDRGCGGLREQPDLDKADMRYMKTSAMRGSPGVPGACLVSMYGCPETAKPSDNGGETGVP